MICYSSLAAMNVSVYLPNNLRSRFESYIKSKGITRNAAICNAIELLLKTGKKHLGGLGSIVSKEIRKLKILNRIAPSLRNQRATSFK